MPIYEAVCSNCGKYHEYICHSSKCYDTPVCCGQATDKRILTPPRTIMDIQPWDAFVSPATGKLITSKSQRKEDMRASGCRDWEGLESEKRMAARSKQYDEEALDKKIETTVRTSIAHLPPQKIAALL